MIGLKITKWVLIVVACIWLISPYILGSILTNTKATEFTSLCINGRVIVLNYSSLNRTGTIYCLYQNASENSRLTVSQKQEGGWSIQSNEVVGKTWYWPFWL
jgi:hypothetical protein